MRRKFSHAGLTGRMRLGGCLRDDLPFACCSRSFVRGTLGNISRKTKIVWQQRQPMWQHK